jgi:Zn-dependent protease/predicted transcriptional regulator
MKWSWKIAEISGIEVRIHATFLILLAWIALVYWQLEGRIEAVVAGIAFILALFACVVLHEFGHALTARRFGIRTRNIVLLPIGGIASIEKSPDTPRQEILIALAGPAVSFALAVLLWLVLAATQGIPAARELSLDEGGFLERLAIVNFLLGAFNLLPAFPMDGGRVFRAALSMRLGPYKATRIAAAVAQAAAVILALVGLRYNLFLFVIAIFIWFAAASEAQMSSIRSALSGTDARSAMLTRFDVLAADAALGEAVALTLAGTQKNFPVLRDGELVGVLRQADLLRGLHDHGKLCRVDQVMTPNVPQIDVNDSLERTLDNIGRDEAGLIAVMDHGRLAGLVDTDNVFELLRIRRALHEHEEHAW